MGRAGLIKRALARLDAASVGGGAALGVNLVTPQGLFMAPAMAGVAANGAAMVVAFFARRCCVVNPAVVVVAAVPS